MLTICQGNAKKLRGGLLRFSACGAMDTDFPGIATLPKGRLPFLGLPETVFGSASP
jgi:hypothetical protein